MSSFVIESNGNKISYRYKIFLFMNRADNIERISKEEIWDFVIIGGGATGLGIALDAASRGYKTVLFEQSDLAKATSSRSTKLVHGGVRYLEQGNISLVREALKERGLLLKNAPHLTKNMTFIIPNYTWFDNLLYTVGLTMYDLLAGRLSLGASKYLSKKKVKEYLPTVREQGLKGGVLYHDGQFDDSRLAVNIAQTAMEKDAVILNYTRVEKIHKDTSGKINGVEVKDIETGLSYQIKTKIVINATGVFVDNIIKMDNPKARKMVRPSQGIHLVLDRLFLPSTSALMIPKTDDGRVLFAVPWHNKILVGTTDTLRDHPELEPHALEQEIEFILNTTGRYLDKKPTREDVLSVFVGLRPLAAPKGEGKKTKEISRNHKIIVSSTGLITITGGKWTTYRKMAEDTVDSAIRLVGLPFKKCVTENLKIHGTPVMVANKKQNESQTIIKEDHLYVYGSDRELLKQFMKERPELAEKLVPEYDYTKAEVVWAVQHELALTVDDVLARRCRMLFLDATAALKAAPVVAQTMADVLHKDQKWIEDQIADFTTLAKIYVL